MPLSKTKNRTTKADMNPPRRSYRSHQAPYEVKVPTWWYAYALVSVAFLGGFVTLLAMVLL